MTKGAKARTTTSARVLIAGDVVNFAYVIQLVFTCVWFTVLLSAKMPAKSVTLALAPWAMQNK